MTAVEKFRKEIKNQIQEIKSDYKQHCYNIMETIKSSENGIIPKDGIFYIKRSEYKSLCDKAYNTIYKPQIEMLKQFLQLSDNELECYLND